MTSVLASLVALAVGAVPEGKTGPARTPADADLAYAGPDWQVWVESTRLPGNGSRGGSPIRTRYYLQKPLGKTATLVADRIDRSSFEVGTVLPDGSVMLTNGSRYLWCEPDGSSVGDRPDGGFGGDRTPSTLLEVPGRDTHYEILAVGPTGAVLQAYVLGSNQPIYFAPLVGRKLDAGSLTQIAAGEVNSPPAFLLRGDWVAWGDSAYNLKTKKRWRFPLEGEVWARWPVALDGRAAVYHDRKQAGPAPDSWRAFDLATGRELSTRGLTRTHEHYVAARDGVGYIVRDRVVTPADPDLYELVAVDLSIGKGGEEVLHRGSPFVGQKYGRMAPRMFESADGWVVWGGDKWVTAGWGGGRPRK